MSAPAQGARRLRGARNARPGPRAGRLEGRKSPFAEIWSADRLSVHRGLRYADYP